MLINRRVFTLSVAAAPLYSAPLTFFTEDEARFVNALLNQIVPADDGPGAVGAGVCFYIDKQLAGPLKRFASVYRNSIPLFRTACAASESADFTALDFARQTAFLKRLEKEKQAPLSGFFALVVEHGMQGFYGSPIHGGNRDGASWKMLGIENVMGGHAH